MKFKDWMMKRNPIFWSLIQKFGLLRLLPPAFGMYILIPVYPILHIICIKLLYNFIVCPLLSVQPINLKNYIIIDRHKISGMSMTARFHCMYCEYANGICVAMGALLGRIACEAKPPAGMPLKALALMVYMPASLLSSLCQSCVMVLYNAAIAPTIGLHRVTLKQAYEKMDASGFADAFTPFGSFGRLLLRYENSVALIHANALEQVESQWCPIRHLATNPEAIFPDHHVNFLDRCELCELRKILCTEGSVSPRKPTG